MARTPEEPYDDGSDPDEFRDGDDPNYSADESGDTSGRFDAMFFRGVSPRVQRLTTLGLVGLATGSFFLALHLEHKPAPKVPATIVPDAGSSFAHITISPEKPIEIASGTKVEAYCYLNARNDYGTYRFIIDEGLYNGQAGEAGRAQLQADTNLYPGTGMGQPNDPFNGLPFC